MSTLKTIAAISVVLRAFLFTKIIILVACQCSGNMTYSTCLLDDPLLGVPPV